MATALFGVFTAGQGFYSDVAWHIALGRDKSLFTAPHTAIVVGLGFIALSGLLGVVFATVQKADVGFRIGALHVPWSMLPLLALGGAAVTGFPLDELWHAQYGIDVTMWSPTHMLMILGASFVGMAAWLVLAEAARVAAHVGMGARLARGRRIPHAARAGRVTGRVHLRRAAVPAALPSGAGDDRRRLRLRRHPHDPRIVVGSSGSRWPTSRCSRPGCRRAAGRF